MSAGSGSPYFASRVQDGAVWTEARPLVNETHLIGQLRFLHRDSAKQTTINGANPSVFEVSSFGVSALCRPQDVRRYSALGKMWTRSEGSHSRNLNGTLSSPCFDVD